MNNETKKILCRRLMWDYNISEDDILDVIDGKKQFAGHYDIKGIFRKSIESYSFDVIKELFNNDQIKELLTDSLIKSLRSPSLRERYFIIKNNL